MVLGFYLRSGTIISIIPPNDNSNLVYSWDIEDDYGFCEWIKPIAFACPDYNSKEEGEIDYFYKKEVSEKPKQEFSF